MATGLEYEATELRLGLPGGGDGEGRNASAKRGFADTIDLKLKLEPAAAAVEEEEEEAGDNREEIVAAAAAEEEEEESSAGKMKRSPSQSSAVVTEKPRAPKAQVVGWPPVRSFRKNIMSVQAEKGSKYKSSSSAAAFVKVSLDGAPYLRKVDLRMYESYQDLSKALDTMFSSFTITGMKRSTNHIGVESFSFGNDNKLKIFPPNSFKFKPKDHIIIDEVQECILDNFLYQYNNKREERGYMLSILNSVAEYFQMTNEALPKYDDHDSIEQKPIYVIFEGSKSGVYISFEEIIGQKVGTKYTGGIS